MPVTDYDAFISEAAKTHNVDPELIRAIMMTESSNDPSATSPKGASGLMQLMPATAKEMGVKNLMDPRENILGGTRYIAQMLEQQGGDIPLALAAYNAGPGNVKKYKGIPPFKETQDYVKKIMNRYQGSSDGYKQVLNEIRVKKGLKTSTKAPAEPEKAQAPDQPLSDYEKILQNIKSGQQAETAPQAPQAPLKSYEELSSKYLDKPPQISYLPTESDVEILKHAGGGALAFFPSVASGLGEMIRHKGRNVLAAAMEGPHPGEAHVLEKKLSAAKSLPEYMEIHEKAMYEKARRELIIEQMKKDPQEIRDKVTDAMSVWTDWMEPPKTERAKAYLKLIDITLNNMLFEQPHKLDKWLSEKGYPNVGWLAGIAGELTVLHGMKSAGKELQGMPKKFNELLKKIEKDVPKDKATLSKGPLLDEMVDKMEKTINDHLDDIGIPKEATASPESLQTYIDATYGGLKRGAPKGVTKSQKQRAHNIAREKGFSEVERRDLAEQVTGHRSMMDMNRESARRFITALRKGKKPKETKKIEKKPWEMDQDEWVAYAEKGKLHKATGKKIKGEEEAQTNIKLGELNKYPDQDIANFYLSRRTYADGTRTPELAKIAYEEYLKDARIEGKRGVKHAEKVGEETRETGREERIEEGEKRPVRVRDVEKDRLEAEEGIVEPPPSEPPKLDLSDDLRIAEDMGIYADIKEMIGKNMKVGEMLKELKQKAYYKEDLKDFGYREADIRKAIRAVKADAGDKTAVKQIETEIKKETDAVKKVEEIPEIEPPSDIQRVDPETGRPAGAEADLIPPSPRMDDITMQAKVAQLPITGASGKILKHRFAVERRMKELGQTGDIVENPKGEGWVMKKSKTQRDVEKRSADAERDAWEEVLKEEELDLIEEGLGKKEDSSILDILADETGAIKIEPEQIKKLKGFFKQGNYSHTSFIRTLKNRGASDDAIREIFPKASAQDIARATGSPWWTPGQDIRELLSRRSLKKGLKAPAVSRGDAHIVATTTDLPGLDSAGISDALIGEKVRTFATSEGIFTQIGKPLREIFYRRAIEADKKSSDYASMLLEKSKKLQETFTLGSREVHSQRVGIYEIAQQSDGPARLKLQGVTKIPKLTPKEQFAYEKLQEGYESLFIEVNKALKASGQKEFKPIKNYSMWAHDMSKLKDFERISIFDDQTKIQKGLDRIRNIPSQIDKLGRTISMKGHEKLRAGPDMPGYLILDAFENYNVYAQLAADVIHKSANIAYMHELLNTKYGLSEHAPNTYKFLSNWLDFQKGHEPIMFVENPKARRLMRNLSSNVAVAYLSYGVRSTIVQLASLNLSFAKLGLHLTHGIPKLLSKAEIKRASKESNVLTTRSPEEILISAQRTYPLFSSLSSKYKIGREVKELVDKPIIKGVIKTTKKIKQIGFKGLFLSDSLVSYLTWFGAEAKAKSLYKKLPKDVQQEISMKDFVKNYADDITVQCQGSATSSARAPIQRHAEGKLITTLGTFTIANFDFIQRHLMGIKNPDITKPQALAATMRFVIASTLISSLFTDGLKLDSPIPTPVDAFVKTLENSDKLTEAFQASVTEILEFIPVYGGKYKFDSELMGPVIDQLVKLGKGDYSSLGRLGGMPGFQTLWKAYRAERQGGTAIDMILGRYLELEESLTAPIGRADRDKLHAPIGAENDW